MRFQFNLTQQTLKLVQKDHSLTLSEPQFYTLGGIGFTLDYSNPSQRWIIFKVNKEKVKVVYKAPQDGSAVCYKRIIPRPLSGIVEIEFSEWDKIKT